MPLSAEALHAKARELSGIDIDDVDAREPFQVLVDSLNKEAALSGSGLVEMEKRLQRLLVNRLRMERDFIGHPEIGDQKIIAPIFIFGMPRTGTTKMQRLLSASGDFTTLPLWMAHNPSLMTGDRDEKTDWRIDDTEQYVRWIDHTSPAARVAHQFDTHEPEEVNPLLEQGFRSAYLPAFVNVPSYIQWYAAQNPRKQMDYLRRVLQYLQWQFDIDASKPWVLKNPTFLGQEPVVREVFPDAQLVMTHRHPAAVISSSASLVVSFRKLYSDTDATAMAGVMMLEGQAWVMGQHLTNRAADVSLDVIDIAYPELTKASMSALEKTYQRIGKPFSEQARSNIANWEAGNHQHKFGTHQYALADFHVSDEVIAEKFRDYIRDYGAYF